MKGMFRKSLGEKVPFEVKSGDMVLKGQRYPMTNALYTKMLGHIKLKEGEALEFGHIAEAQASFFPAMIAEWDATDDDGAAVPVTAENLARLDFTLYTSLLKIVFAAQELIGSKEEVKN